jgi:hypothetical protein
MSNSFAMTHGSLGISVEWEQYQRPNSTTEITKGDINGTLAIDRMTRMQIKMIDADKFF